MYLSEAEYQPQTTIPPAPKPRPTYSQDWTNYNFAQTNEKTRFLELLFELCSHIDEMPRKNIQGRNRIPLSDMVFAIVYKIYSGVSGRRLFPI